MNNELYRKLTSITLMTIMFAGGMTIAIPGELPTAVAQTTSGTLSVSANGSFGGPQILEIVVDDPDRAETDSPPPDVKIDEVDVQMSQAATGKWYAYFADQSAYGALDITAAESDTTLLRDVPTLATRSPDRNLGLSPSSRHNTTLMMATMSRSRPAATRWLLSHTKTAAPSR